MERKLARIAKIDSLSPIPGADLIELATYKGWQFVVKKGEFKVGDLGVYFEIDSVLDSTNPVFSFLMKNGKMPYLRTKRLKGQISQGLMLPITCLNHYGKHSCPYGEHYLSYSDEHGDHTILLTEGTDVTDLTKTVKYEPEIPAQLSGLVKGNFPSFLVKTDQERVQNIPEIIEEIVKNMYPVTITIKFDGTSATYFYKDGEFGVCSRNLQLKDTEDNTYWKIARKYNLETLFNKFNPGNRNLAIQGEICGPGIQKNRLGLTEQKFFVFAVFDIDKHEYVGFDELQSICKRFQLETVDVLYHNALAPFVNLEGVLSLADSAKYSNGSPAEGIVIQTTQPTFSPILNGRITFKAISNKYLEKHGL
jgi:RNA ligase (TIGR02306 family)